MKRYLKQPVQGYLHTKGRRIYNEADEEVLLCGWGTGNWMNPEGFMVSGVAGMHGFTSMEDKLQYNIRFDRARTMNDSIRELCGSDYARSFWPRWYRNHLSEADIKAMAEAGCNSVRLCLDASGLLFEEPGITWNEDSFEMLNDVLDWCERWGIYAILDLHGAPGGQSGVSCDNGIDNVPRLFMEPESYDRALILWEELARRYQHRFIVGGYELLNEPISTPQWHYLLPKLRKFYEDAIARIRQVDKKHMIILHGAAFAHDMRLFDRGFDEECGNWCYSVHSYWFTPDMNDFYQYLEPSLRLEVPVWIGEGRGSDKAMAVFYEMMAEYGIGFNLFCWKSMDNMSDSDHGFLHYPMPKGWELVVKYIAEGGPRPTYKEAQAMFDEMLELCKYENCSRRESINVYSQRRQGIVLPAVGYDSYGGQGVSFKGSWDYGNAFNYRTQDHMKMVGKPGGVIPGMFDPPMKKADPLENLLLELSDNEFANYTIYKVETSCPVSFTARAISDTQLKITCGDFEKVMEIKAGDELQKYSAFVLDCGEYYTVKFTVESGSIQLENIFFD